MDFMKVFDQTVREIKREVNLKVLKVPEIEQKVLDATSDEPWGPHGSDLSEIAQATKKFTECQMVMNVLWQRVAAGSGANWRHVYKALAIIEYLLANGSERAVDDILDSASQISALSRFEYVEPNGKDVGINVRKKVETILSILNDKEKIQAIREKAAATRDKYFGLSSSGITYKSSSSSYGGSSSSSYKSSDRYGSLSGSREADSFKDSFQDMERDGKETSSNNIRRDSEEVGSKSKKGVAKVGRNQDSLPSNSGTLLPKPGPSPSKAPTAQPDSTEDDFDDFDPRASSTSAKTSSNNVDLFGHSLMDDLIDAPTSTSTETTTFTHAAAPDADLFADATFQSAAPHAEATTVTHSQNNNIDLFAGQTTFAAAFPPPSTPAEMKPSISESTRTNTFDPFAAIPLNNFQGPDMFGTFTSNTESSTTTEPSQNSKESPSNSNQSPLADFGFGAFSSNTDGAATVLSHGPTNNSPNKSDQASSGASKPATKKDTFQVKSGVWADSLSRGLIDLNITAPKKVNLADIGIVGGLGGEPNEKEKNLAADFYIGRAMGTGSGLGRSGFSSSSGNGSFSTLDQQQFGSFK